MTLLDGTDRKRAAVAREERMLKSGRADPRSAPDFAAARRNDRRRVQVTINMRMVKRGRDTLHVATISGPKGTKTVTVLHSRLDAATVDATYKSIADAVNQVRER